MSNIPYLKIFTDSKNVSNVDYLDINFSSAEFTSPPIINASSNENVNIYISNITLSTARLNFSSKFTGNVTYIIRPSTN
jgi:hypothetical protein